MKFFALVVAGGAGSRMSQTLPKQFIILAGKPLLMHTLEVFSRFVSRPEIVLVLPDEYRQLWDDLCNDHGFTVSHRVVTAGETRFLSVRNGLAALPEEGIVFIHDGVRPLVSQETLQRCLQTAILHGNAIPTVPVAESVRWSNGETSHPVDRSRLFLIQTPQTFLIPLIKKAYRQDYDPQFTDDASVLEKSGEAIRLVGGNQENIKITWPADLAMAEGLLTHQPSL